LVGLAGVEADLVEREVDGSWTVHVTSAPGEVACPGCGQGAGRVKERRVHPVAHMVVVPMRVSWHKSRRWCDNQECATATFTESGPLVAAAAGVGGVLAYRPRRVRPGGR
jgi:transposase